MDKRVIKESGIDYMLCHIATTWLGRGDICPYSCRFSKSLQKCTIELMYLTAIKDGYEQ